MTDYIKTRIFSIFSGSKSKDFSIFVSEYSKIEKEKMLKRAADHAIKEQLRTIEAVSA